MGSVVKLASEVVSICRKMLVGIIERVNAKEMGVSSGTMWEKEGKDAM